MNEPHAQARRRASKRSCRQEDNSSKSVEVIRSSTTTTGTRRCRGEDAEKAKSYAYEKVGQLREAAAARVVAAFAC
jgi:hypothetical protein